MVVKSLTLEIKTFPHVVELTIQTTRSPTERVRGWKRRAFTDQAKSDGTQSVHEDRQRVTGQASSRLRSATGIGAGTTAICSLRITGRRCYSECWSAAPSVFRRNINVLALRKSTNALWQFRTGSFWTTCNSIQQSLQLFQNRQFDACSPTPAINSFVRRVRG